MSFSEADSGDLSAFNTRSLSSFISVAVMSMLLAPLAVAQQVNVAGPGAKSIAIPSVQVNATIDGVLSDAVWEQAVLIDDLHQVFPEEFDAPTQRTEVRLYYTSEALYVSARMFETDKSQIAAQVLRQGQALGADDIFAIILDPYLDRRNGYRFEVNANSVRWEGLFQNINDVEGNWDGIWEARSVTDAEGWTTEIRIPFQTLSFNPDSSSWGINFNRLRRRSGESIAWMSSNREINPANAGTITGITGLEQGLGLDVVPSFSMGRRRRFGPLGSDENNYEPSLDVFYKVTPQLNASLTINTDFSATEVDDRQVNLTRFNLFFPEKRDFFLRDVDIFEFGQIGQGGFNPTSGTGTAASSTPARQNARPFFSRKIGIDSAGAPVDLNGGVKLSGRVGDWNVGTLVINQDESEATGVDAQNIFVGRAVLNVGARTQVGAIVTDGNPQSNLDNTLVGTDFRYRNANFHGTTVETVAFYEQTDTEGTANDNNAAWGYGVVLPNSQGWQGLYHYRRVEDNFNPAVGFVNRAGIEEDHLHFGYRYFFPPAGPIRSILTAFDGYQAQTLSDGRFSSGNNGFRISGNNNRGDQAFTRYIRNREVLLQNFVIYRSSDGLRSVVIPPGDYTFDEQLISVQFGGQRKISANLYATNGEYYNGTHFQHRGNITWRPNRNLSIDVSMTDDRIKLPAGNFTVRQFGFNTQFAFSSTLSWSNLIQYDNVSENMGFNSRLHWIPKAGQQAFVVLNWGLTDSDKDNSFVSTIADLSMKFNYTFRF
ncbi:MAG: carbohydrate binding family 9 domain-containing protein [Pseudomonadota bacterium]